MDGVADIGAAPFSVTQIRSTVVDFSLPLLEGNLRLFIKNPEVLVGGKLYFWPTSTPSLRGGARGGAQKVSKMMDD